MNDVVDRVMSFYEKLPAIEGVGREEIRVKVGQYLAKLSSAGHRRLIAPLLPLRKQHECISVTTLPG